MRTVKICIFAILIFFTCSLTAFSEDNGDFSEFEKEYYNILKDSLSSSASDVLDEAGINSFSFEEILSSQPKDIADFFLGMAKGRINTPIKNFMFSCVVIVAVSVAFSYLSENEKKKKAVNLIVYTYISLSVIIPMSSLLSSGSAAIKTSSNFMLTLMPVLSGIVAAAKNPMLAVNYNSFAMYFAQIASSFASNILMPLEGMFFALICINISFDAMRIKNLSSIIKNTVTKTLVVLATIFVSILSVKGILSNAADTVTSKGAKMLVSSLVPVIGSSVSEAYATILNSLVLLKSSVGMFGITAIAVINLPVIIELFFWSLSLTASSVVANMFDLKSVASFYNDVSDTIKTFNAILVFCCVLFVISTGILLVIKNGV